MKKDKKTLVILDAHALIHRSYHALPSFTSPSGEPMGAVYGVSAVLLKLIRELKPTHLVAAFDREEPTFRHKAYDGYKGKREKTKDDLIPQFEKTKEVFKAFKMPTFEIAGFEADDIIGTLVDRFKKEKDLTIIIASGDMDTMQLIDDERVLVYTLRKGIEDTILYNEEKVKERYGFGPEHIADYKGLKGDPSDNIIGIPGIGEKTATQLITHYGSIEEMYTKLKSEKKHPTWLKERILKLLLENEEEALFSKELATIRRDAEVNPKLEELAFPGIPYDSVTAIFRTLHFPSLIARLGAPEQTSIEVKNKKEDKKLSKDTWKDFSETFTVVQDTVLYMEGESLVFINKEEFFVCTRDDAFQLRSLLDSLLSKMEHCIAVDAKEIFHFVGFTFPIEFDVKLAALILDSEQRSFDVRENIDPKAKTLFDGITNLARKQRTLLEREKLATIYFDFELPLVPVLTLMEMWGILIDPDKLSVLEKKVSKEIKKLEIEICKQAGEDFDVNSPKQLSRILFEVLKLPTKGIKKTSTKTVSTQFSELTKLQSLHPIIDLLIRYREITKLFSTYISVLPKLAGEDGRIHTTFNQIGAATGRLSSNNPNLQNIPIRTELGREIRKAFIPAQGYTLVSFDYSQLELRIAAQLANDQKLIDAFRGGEDIHTRTASAMFHVSMQDVTQTMRRSAKTINFGVLYGMGARALAAGIGVSAAEAEQYLIEYLKEFSGIDQYRKKIINEGAKKGHVETFFGRKRYIPNLRSSFDFVRKEAERMAINAPFQGTASDLIKRAMIKIAQECDLVPTNTDVKMLLQVHDELVFEIRKDKADAWIQRIRDIMEDVPEFSVPIIVEAKEGTSWDDMIKIPRL